MKQLRRQRKLNNLKKKGYTCYGCGARTLHQKVRWFDGHPYCKYCYRYVAKFQKVEDILLSFKEKEKIRYTSKYKSSRRGKG